MGFFDCYRYEPRVEHHKYAFYVYVYVFVYVFILILILIYCFITNDYVISGELYDTRIMYCSGSGYIMSGALVRGMMANMTHYKEVWAPICAL